jgi:hypothetical protein
MTGTLVNSIITVEFSKLKTPENKDKGMLLSFRTARGKDEEGYRHADLFISAPCNYVEVWVRTRWCVIPIEDLEEGADGETYIKSGKDYTKGESEWTLVSCHDSCWPEGIRKFFQENKVVSIDTYIPSRWYEVVERSSLTLKEKA